MRKARTSGQRIKELRDSRGETQAVFATHFDVQRAIVSSWEGDDDLRKPSAVVYLKLAALARNPQEAAYFLSLAEIEQRTVFSLAEKLAEGKLLAAKSGDVVRLGPLPGTEDHGEILLPRARVPNPRFTYYAFGLESLTWLALEPGLIFLDTKDAGDRVAPFWSEIAVARRRSDVGNVSEHFLGKIWMVQSEAASPTHVSAVRFSVMAGAQRPSRWQGFLLGRHFHPRWGEADFHRRIAADDDFSRCVHEDTHRRAFSGMRTDSGIEIVGRVIAWFPYEKAGARGDE